MKQYQWFALAAALAITTFEMFSVGSETHVARDVTIGTPAPLQATLAEFPSTELTLSSP